jgi:hypothetical protein
MDRTKTYTVQKKSPASSWGYRRERPRGEEGRDDVRANARLSPISSGLMSRSRILMRSSPTARVCEQSITAAAHPIVQDLIVSRQLARYVKRKFPQPRPIRHQLPVRHDNRVAAPRRMECARRAGNGQVFSCAFSATVQRHTSAAGGLVHLGLETARPSSTEVTLIWTGGPRHRFYISRSFETIRP